MKTESLIVGLIMICLLLHALTFVVINTKIKQSVVQVKHDTVFIEKPVVIYDTITTVAPDTNCLVFRSLIYENGWLTGFTKGNMYARGLFDNLRPLDIYKKDSLHYDSIVKMSIK